MMIRKNIAIFCIGLATLMPILLSGVFLGGRMLIRRIMLERLEENSTISLRLESKDIQWVEKGRELMIEGRMFDVKSMEREGSEWVVKGLYDDMETELTGKWAADQENNSGKENRGLSLFQVCLGIIGVQPENSTHNMSGIPDLSPTYQTTGAEMILSYSPPVLSPPPEI